MYPFRRDAVFLPAATGGGILPGLSAIAKGPFWAISDCLNSRVHIDYGLLSSLRCRGELKRLGEHVAGRRSFLD
jgi:hypothetical protein